MHARAVVVTCLVASFLGLTTVGVYRRLLPAPALNAAITNAVRSPAPGSEHTSSLGDVGDAAGRLLQPPTSFDDQLPPTELADAAGAVEPLAFLPSRAAKPAHPPTRAAMRRASSSLSPTATPPCPIALLNCTIRAATRDILFAVVTGSNHHATRLAWHHAAWSAYVSRVLYFSDSANTEVNAVATVALEGTGATWDGSQRKWYLALDHLCKHRAGGGDSPPDWVAFSDDDTMRFPHNLAGLLRSFSPTKRLYFGKLLRGRLGPARTPFLFASGGAGFVLSRATMDWLCSSSNGLPTLLAKPPSRFSDAALGAVLHAGGSAPTNVDAMYPGRRPPGSPRYGPVPKSIAEPEGPIVGHPISFHYQKHAHDFAASHEALARDVCGGVGLRYVDALGEALCTRLCLFDRATALWS